MNWVKKFLMMMILGLVCVFAVLAQTTTVADLDAAIQQASSDIYSKNIAPKVALVNFNSPSNDLSAFVLREMALIMEKKVATLIARQNIDYALSAINLRASSEVTDANARQIGRTVGADIVVTSSLVKINDIYRFRTRVINVANGVLQMTGDYSISDTQQLARYIPGAAPAPKPAPVAPAPAPAATPAPAPVPASVPAKPAAPAKGTYTFYPRPQATQGGIPVRASDGASAYIDRIVVSGKYFTVFLVAVPEGKARGYMMIPGNNWRGSAEGSIKLQDLDNPRLTYNVVNTGDDPETGGVFNTFEGVTARRFSLSNSYTGQLTSSGNSSPPVVFEEIVMPAQPDE